MRNRTDGKFVMSTKEALAALKHVQEGFDVLLRQAPAPILDASGVERERGAIKWDGLTLLSFWPQSTSSPCL